MTIPATPRMLSIQSHVVSGYCGNKSATFPLQLLEFEVDVVNSVQLSNHTQYKLTRGQIFESKHLDELHTGLKANNLLKLYDNVLSGYVANLGYIESLANLIQDVKQERRSEQLDCWYTLDPVLGDDGVGYYVPNGFNVANSYKKYLLPLADIVTPNRFEASILSGVEIDPNSNNIMDQAMEAINVFHKQMGIQIVVITSLAIETDEDVLTCILSNDPNSKRTYLHNYDNYPPEKQENNSEPKTWIIRVPKLDCPFTGTGDLFTALLTGWLHKTQFDCKLSFENTANTIHDVLEDTLAWHKQVGDGSVQSHELRLVQNRDKILTPSERFKAVPYGKSSSLSENSMSESTRGNQVLVTEGVM